LRAMAFTTNPRRDASPTIAGFVFQVNLTILRWLELQDGHYLELECGEDIDVVESNESTEGREIRILEQLKTRTGRSITLRSAEALEALSNYCEHRANNPDSNLSFRFITTADSGIEQGWNRDESGIETWTGLRQGRYGELDRRSAIADVQALLASCKKPPKTAERVWKALQKAVTASSENELNEIILGFEWGVGYGNYSQIESEVIRILRGRVSTKIDAEPAYQHLFAFVFRLLCQSGRKSLTAEMLASKLLNPALTQSDLLVLQSIRSELTQLDKRITTVENAVVHQAKDVSVLKHSVDLIGRTFGFEPSFILTKMMLSSGAPEQVHPCLPRERSVLAILALLQNVGASALVAEPGSGKTQLLLLAVAQSGRPAIWLNLPRQITEEQACMLLDALIQNAGGQLAELPFRECYDAAVERLDNSLVVIDDLPQLIPRGPLAARIERLVLNLRNVGGGLLVSSYFPLPATTENMLGKPRYNVPRLTADDIERLLLLAGAPVALRNSATCNLLAALSEGLPTLVMSAVRFLANSNWQFTAAEIESLCRGEFAAPHRLDANELLKITVPDPEERELLGRLSLAVGAFSMEDIGYVARVKQTIRLPGEKVKRSTGVWLQKIADEEYLRSPLITSALADFLDPETRKNVHFVLALRILARKILAPIDGLTAINHFQLAGQTTHAVLVAVKTLTAYIEYNEPIDDYLGFAKMWPSSSSLSAVDPNLQINLRSAQVIVLAKQKRDVTAQLANFDKLVAELGATGWGVAIAAISMAIHLVWSFPIKANECLLLALATFADARLPDGSSLPSLRDTPLEHMLWVSANNCRSNADIDSWLSTLERFKPNQIDVLKSSELMEDNITILCDGIWLRVYQKPENERDWTPVTNKLLQIEAVAKAAHFPLLEASAIRTRIMILAECENRMEEALKLKEKSLSRFRDEDCRFLVLEITGRQLGYAGRQEEALTLLKLAIACSAYRQSILRRNVLITMAKLSVDEPREAVTFTTEAVKLCLSANITAPQTIESFAEQGIALWNSDQKEQSLFAFEQATDRALAIKNDGESWKGMLALLFGVIAYFSGVAADGAPQHGHVEPEQGLFLSSNAHAISAYKPEQVQYVCVRLAMFADGIRNIDKAAVWTWKAIEFAKSDPIAWNVTRFSCWRAIPAALLSNDFVRAARLVEIVGGGDVSVLIDTVKATPSVNATPGADSRIKSVMDSGATAPKSALNVLAAIPIVIRLAVLQLQGRPSADIVKSLEAIESELPAEAQPENFVAVAKRALTGSADWKSLWTESVEASKVHQYLRSSVLSVGSVVGAPATTSLHLQVYLAQNLEGFFKKQSSIYREIIAPFFVVYWERVILESVGLFRTSNAYTSRQLQVADLSPTGTRKLLSAMRFCIGVKLPKAQTEWLEG
jgi:hypothetical protein